jgi:hypothetical protein
MKSDPLLEAIFEPGQESLRPALAAARRRRVRRTLAPILAGAVCLAGLAWLLVRQVPSAASHTEPILETVLTRPNFAPEIVRTAAGSVEIITTTNDRTAPAELSDPELLNLFNPGRAALVGSGRNRRFIKY